jgi:hypothetical protein
MSSDLACWVADKPCMTSVPQKLQVEGWATRVLRIDEGMYAELGRVFAAWIKRCLKGGERSEKLILNQVQRRNSLIDSGARNCLVTFKETRLRIGGGLLESLPRSRFAIDRCSENLCSDTDSRSNALSILALSAAGRLLSLE